MKYKAIVVFLTGLLLLHFVSPSYAAPRYQLHVQTTPKNAGVFLMNIKPKFQQGMLLAPGVYDILVSKQGFKKHRQLVRIRDRSVTLRVTLQPLQKAASAETAAEKKSMSMNNEAVAAVKYALTVDVIPEDAKIYIMNIKPQFEQNMTLPPGKYDVLVTKKGYSAKRQWVEITNSDIQLEVELSEENDSQQSDNVENSESTSSTVETAQATESSDNVTESDTAAMVAESKSSELADTVTEETKSLPTETEIEKSDLSEKASDDAEMAATNQAMIQKPDNLETHKLIIKTVPSDAEVQILNVKPKFRQGLPLKSGKYDLRISRPGYLTRRQWVEIADKDVSLEITLSPPSECFFGESHNTEVGQTISTLHSVTLKFNDKFVEVNYIVNNVLSGTTNFYTFKGVKTGNDFDLIGLVEYEGRQEEITALMTLKNNVLTVELNGNRNVLNKVSCH